MCRTLKILRNCILADGLFSILENCLYIVIVFKYRAHVVYLIEIKVLRTLHTKNFLNYTLKFIAQLLLTAVRSSLQ